MGRGAVASVADPRRGGELDGESVFRLEGFNADANGVTFDPPLDLPGATGLKMSCGYDNWTSEDVQWGADGAYVWKIVDGAVQRIPIKIIQRQQGRVMVDGADRLTPDDVIVTEGIQRLRPGLPVSAQKEIAGDAAVRRPDPSMPG